MALAAAGGGRVAGQWGLLCGGAFKLGKREMRELDRVIKGFLLRLVLVVYMHTVPDCPRAETCAV